MKFISNDPRPQSYNGCLFKRNRYGKTEFIPETEKQAEKLMSLPVYKSGKIYLVEDVDTIVAKPQPAPTNGKLKWQELRKKARESNIKGWKSMNRAQLEEALA